MGFRFYPFLILISWCGLGVASKSPTLDCNSWLLDAAAYRRLEAPELNRLWSQHEDFTDLVEWASNAILGKTIPVDRKWVLALAQKLGLSGRASMREFESLFAAAVQRAVNEKMDRMWLKHRTIGKLAQLFRGKLSGSVFVLSLDDALLEKNAAAMLGSEESYHEVPRLLVTSPYRSQAPALVGEMTAIYIEGQPESDRPVTLNTPVIQVAATNLQQFRFLSQSALRKSIFERLLELCPDQLVHLFVHLELSNFRGGAQASSDASKQRTGKSVFLEPPMYMTERIALWSEGMIRGDLKRLPKYQVQCRVEDGQPVSAWTEQEMGGKTIFFSYSY